MNKLTLPDYSIPCSFRVYLGVITCEFFLCLGVIVFLLYIVSRFFVTLVVLFVESTTCLVP